MMDSIAAAPLTFLQIHIDAARNSTDDFNLFHDPRKWHRIRGNPFAGPIVLGFQLECLVEDQLRLNRQQTGEAALIESHQLRFSNYQFTFASVVKPGESVQVEIKKSQLRLGENAALSNRVAVKGEHGLVLFGFKKESQAPLFLSEVDLSHLPDLSRQADRSYVHGTTLFYKRKFMSTGHAKNFLSGSLADQSAFFDELEERVEFPETYPAGLISCALLERARANGHDFERDPMVYTAHNISVDRQLTRGLRSNDALHLLVDAPVRLASEKNDDIAQYVHHCYGVLQDGAVLFRAIVAMMPLEAIPRSA
jgi:hypothetical protein